MMFEPSSSPLTLSSPRRCNVSPSPMPPWPITTTPLISKPHNCPLSKTSTIPILTQQCQLAGKQAAKVLAEERKGSNPSSNIQSGRVRHRQSSKERDPARSLWTTFGKNKHDFSSYSLSAPPTVACNAQQCRNEGVEGLRHNRAIIGVLCIQIIEIEQMCIEAQHLDTFLGEGAFSWVYGIKNKPFAAKISKHDNRDFQEEFALLESLGKTNGSTFPQVITTGTIILPGRQAPTNYMTMERLSVSLQEFLIFRGEVGVGTIVEIGRQLLGQLQGLMRRGIVHNDIKPSNILFGMGERRKRAFLVDYGMATTSSEVRRVFRGNLAFAPSRKLRGNIHYDLRNDVESLIYVLLWALRNGNLPWQQEDCEGSLSQRTEHILVMRQQFKEDYLKLQGKGDRRDILMGELVVLLGEEMEAWELLRRVRSVL